MPLLHRASSPPPEAGQIPVFDEQGRVVPTDPDSGTSASVLFEDYVEAELDSGPLATVNDTPVILPFDTIGYSDGTSLTPPAIDGSDSVWTVTADGLYVLAAYVSWADNNVGKRLLQGIVGGGVDNFPLFGAGLECKYFAPPNTFDQMLVATLPLSAGMTVSFGAYQSSGGALNITFAQGSVTRAL